MITDIADRIHGVIVRIRRVRENLYPPDWNTDHLLPIEKDLQKLLDDMGSM